MTRIELGGTQYKGMECFADITAHHSSCLCFAGVYLIIILLACVGYVMIDSQRVKQLRVGYNHLISNKRKWNNCFIRKQSRGIARSC